MEEILLIGLGLIFGSFLNVVIHRLPLGESIVSPGSRCTSCGNPVKSYDNIPVISYIILMGKCRKCGERISIRYPLVEILTGVTFWLCYYHFFHDIVYMCFAILFCCIIIALGLIDMDHMILPHELTWSGAVIFLGYSFFNPYLTPMRSFGAALGGALFFLLLYIFYVKFRKMEGLGQGDIWMMLSLGAFLGPEMLVVTLVVSTFTGLFIGMFFIIFQKKNLKMELPFGTFLALGSYVSLFWGYPILKWMQSFLRPGG